jgi:acylphosphatase
LAGGKQAKALVESRLGPSAMLQARRFFVSGIVQGVGFRFFAERVAGRLGIAGYVKNLRDGRVEVYAIGSEEQLRALRGELKRGPSAASVDEVGEVEEAILQEYANGFGVDFD